MHVSPDGLRLAAIQDARELRIYVLDGDELTREPVPRFSFDVDLYEGEGLSWAGPERLVFEGGDIVRGADGSWSLGSGG